VQWLVVVEALLLAVLAAAAGLLCALVILPAVSSIPAVGVGPMHVPHSVFGIGMIVAAVLALVSGVPPAQRARRLQVAAALSGR
jgi:putative ABC transport system permease protein